MKKIIKRMCVLLALLMIVSAMSVSLTSCKKGEEDEETTSPDSVSTVDGTEKEINYKDYLPEATYDGAEINIYHMNARLEQFFTDMDNPEMTAFNRAVYERNLAVEEKYDVVLNFYCESNPTGEDQKFVSVCTQAGAYEYDIMIPDYYWGTEVQGAFVNLLDYDVLKFENPYWVSGWNDSATVNNRLYTAVGYFTTDPIGKSMVVFCNGKIAYDYLGLEDINQLVKSGDWTLETMKTMMAANTMEVDGDGNPTFADSYGLGYNLWGGRALLWGCGLKMSEYKNGEVTFKMREQKNSDIFDSVYDFLKNNNYSYYRGNSDLAYGTASDNDFELFKSERALFYIFEMGQSAKINQTMKKYSVLPMPKLDTDQSDYITPLRGTVTFGIFKTGADPQRAATILEALNIYSYEDVISVYYDDMLKFRYQSDSESAEMLDFIREKISVDFLFVNEASFRNVTNVPFDLIEAEDGNYEGTMAGKMNALNTSLEKFMRVYSE